MSPHGQCFGAFMVCDVSFCILRFCSVDIIFFDFLIDISYLFWIFNHAFTILRHSSFDLKKPRGTWHLKAENGSIAAHESKKKLKTLLEYLETCNTTITDKQVYPLKNPQHEP